METDKGADNYQRGARRHIERNGNEQGFDTATQALGALDWMLVQLVFDARASTARALRRDLAHEGIEIPESIIESSKWFRAFHAATSVVIKKDRFLGLFSDRLRELGFEQGAIRKAINYIGREAGGLYLDVQTAVVTELRRDLESAGVRVPSSILASAGWRDVLARGEVHLPPGAASIVQNGTDDALFSPLEES